MNLCKLGLAALLFLVMCSCSYHQDERQRLDFTENWKFQLGDIEKASQPEFVDSDWRILNLPHDWSIEGEFSEDHPTKVNGGALPAGIGWYRKSFKVEQSWKEKHVFIDFDGVYRNSEVWINGHYLGKRPYGYSSFRYDLTSFLNFGDKANVLAVRVDNSAQPNSRWYTGSGIYRNVWLVATTPVHVAHWGTFVTTPEVSGEAATVKIEIKVSNQVAELGEIKVVTEFFNPEGKKVSTTKTTTNKVDSAMLFNQQIELKKPELWSTENPVQYKAVTKIYADGKLADQYETPFGIRYFKFDAAKGFFLNGKSLKIFGVNNHHDLGALGAAFNTRAAERQLEILKAMGCNAIRMSHNPPAPELLDLCDRMGFIVMDEAFDIWIRQKMEFDYHVDWKEWHQRDLDDMVLRDRNHPSVMMWSIGNEIPEQFDTIGIRIGREMVGMVKKLDTSRPVTSGMTEQDPAKNYIYQSKALDLISFNYKHKQYLDFPKNYLGESLLAAENMSAFATRGHYDMPSDSVRIWPQAYTLPLKANSDFTASSYDNCHALWGATHEETWKVIKGNDFISGMFVWSGFDFLGEPEPYKKWPARSSYYGIVDLCGFPKDIYYFYQSEWTNQPVLHLFPHWNWKEGQTIDVWSYYNNADEVELFLNGVSQGISTKTADRFHAFWRVKFASGTIKAVSRKNGKTVLKKEIHTAGKPAKIELTADRTALSADGKDLAFITVKVTDEAGNMVPDAANLINFNVTGSGCIVGVDNGCQTSMEPFKASYRKAFNGMCLLIVQTDKTSGEIKVKATSEGLQSDEILLKTIKLKDNL
jgi:beta-galactosidase